MGSARVECISECSCEAVSVDALHTADRDSIMVPLGLAVSQSESCQMKITVEKETKSGEHKFKVRPNNKGPESLGTAFSSAPVSLIGFTVDQKPGIGCVSSIGIKSMLLHLYFCHTRLYDTYFA